MRGIFKDLRRLAAVVATLPVTFLAIYLGWHWIDSAVGRREVAAFIELNQSTIEKWQAHPRVKSFSLSQDLKQRGALVICFDVDDKQTFLKIEEDLFSRTSGLRIPPIWNTTLRSNEDLGNEWGFAAEGIGEAVNEARRLTASIVTAFFVFALALWTANRSWARHHFEPS